MADEGGDAGDYGQDIVWVCTQCGRHHQKHSPPCSRCGNVDLEKQRPDFSDLEEPGGTSYLDVLEPKYAAGYLAVIGFAVLVALSMAGVVSVPWLGEPSPPGAPGDAEAYGNVSLENVEGAYVEGTNEARSQRGLDRLSVDESLDGAATAFNQRQVRAATGDESPPEMERILSQYDPQCSPRPVPDAATAPAATVFANGTAGLDATVERLPIVQAATAAERLQGGYRAVGVDVHVSPNDTVYATVIFC